jgi:hypothetical protein
MAVMARQLDIPSRVVLGFTPGTLLEDGRVVVRDRNAHAWVELWMPTQGWVRFDPTPRSDGINPATIEGLPFDIDRYLEAPAIEAPPAQVPEAPPLIPARDLGPQDVFLGSGTGAGEDGSGGASIPAWVMWMMAGVIGAFGLIPGIKWIRRRRRMHRLASGDIAAAWSEIVDHLDDLGMRTEATSTPREVAGEVAEVMVPLADAYGSSLYGDPGQQTGGAVATAARSLEETKQTLAVRFALGRRLAAHYRLRSLAPRWVRKRWGRR